jgi:hypothetical protein
MKLQRVGALPGMRPGSAPLALFAHSDIPSARGSVTLRSTVCWVEITCYLCFVSSLWCVIIRAGNVFTKYSLIVTGNKFVMLLLITRKKEILLSKCWTWFTWIVRNPYHWSQLREMLILFSKCATILCKRLIGVPTFLFLFDSKTYRKGDGLTSVLIY